MSQKTKENYLKAMYVIKEEKGVISLSDLGKRLAVSMPTVNSMAKRMHEEGLVVYEKYKPLRLTATGKKAAALIVRRHRIVEMFLVEKMQFGWEEVHDIAEEMEHVQSAALFERMTEMLGNPAFDPHGSPIPDENGKVSSYHHIRLSDTQKGDLVQLKALHDDDTKFLKFLNSKNLKLGVQISVDDVEDFDGSMTISYAENTGITLSHEVCERLFVEISEGS